MYLIIDKGSASTEKSLNKTIHYFSIYFIQKAQDLRSFKQKLLLLRISVFWYLHVKYLFFIFAKYIYMVGVKIDFPQKCLMFIPTAKFCCNLLSIFVDGSTQSLPPVYELVFVRFIQRTDKNDTEIDTIAAIT
jgi:hypothetical protein